jgi:hypothetical protein
MKPLLYLVAASRAERDAQRHSEQGVPQDGAAVQGAGGGQRQNYTLTAHPQSGAAAGEGSGESELRAGHAT